MNEVPLLYLGYDWLLFSGRLPDIAAHCHPALAVCAALDRPFELVGRGRARLALIAADAPAPAMRFFNGRMAFLFLSPRHRAFPALQAQVVPLGAALDDGFGVDWWALLGDAARARNAAALDARLAELPAPGPAEARVARVMALLDADPGGCGLESLARQVGVSPSRLQHLFKEVSGTTLRRYRLWAKLQRAVAGLALGQRLTDAALEAGFTDSSHLSRSVRDLFGLAPRSALNSPLAVEVRCLPRPAAAGEPSGPQCLSGRSARPEGDAGQEIRDDTP